VTMSWRWAPIAVAATFVTIWTGHVLTRIVARSLGSALVAAAVALRSALDRWPDPGTA
jgi:hypothetical protein